MGVLTDYFRAVDAASVVRAVERTESGSPLVTTPPVFDGFEAERVDPAVVPGRLIAAVDRTEWRVDLVERTTVRPASPAPGPDGPGTEDGPWVTGPWVSELRPLVRDALAGIHDVDVPAVVARWVRAEELDGARADDVRPPVEEFVRLAGRPREAGDQLHCWTSL